MSYAIETIDLTYRAGRHFALHRPGLHVPVGAIYGFLGPNGSGKTTTIRLLLGLLRPAGGTIRVLDGTMPADAPRLLARICYVPERPHLYASLSVTEALRFHAAFHRNWDGRWAEALRSEFGLAHDARLGRLSKGEMGKLMTLLALAQRPELLVMDEPTDGLDPVVRREVLSALLQYVSERNATVFISSHLVHELERICDWVGVLDRGRLVAELPMDSFKRGIKRLRVRHAPATLHATPFVLLTRDVNELDGTEVWTVRDWEDSMRQYFAGLGASLIEVVDLDLEAGFVELLRSSRTPAAA